MSDSESASESTTEFDLAVIIDNGSGALKVGKAGDSRPQAIIPNIIGRPNRGRALLKRHRKEEDDEPEILIGDEVLDKTGHIDISYPMTDGIVTEWTDMQTLWERAFEEIEEDPTEQPVLLTEAPFNPKKNREKMVEIMFEALEVPALQIKMQALCSLFASGRTTGLVIDSGDGVTHAVPVFKGFVIREGIQRSNVAGREVTQMLQRMLFQKGYNFSSHREMQFVREIKEAGCYIAEDFAEEEDKCKKDDSEVEFEHTLPDGQSIRLTNERFKAPEILFDPMRMDSEAPGLSSLAWSAIKACSIDSRAVLMSNIVLSGGNTLFPGLAKRLQSELVNLRGPSATVVKVMEDPARAELVFAGASVLASQPSFNQEWLKAETYEEEGVNCVEYSCFS